MRESNGLKDFKLQKVAFAESEQDYQQEEFTTFDLGEELKKIVKREDGLHVIDQKCDEYQHLTLWKVESIQDKRPLSSYDHGLHILVQRLFKKSNLKEQQSFSIRTVEKEVVLSCLDDYVKGFEREAECALDFFFKDGETYTFNQDDGVIIPETFIVEKDGYYDIYAYYAYVGK